MRSFIGIGNRAISVEEAAPIISDKVSQPPMSGDELNEMCIKFSGSEDFQYALQAMRLSSINTKYDGVQYRLFFGVHEGIVWLLHSIEKKSAKTPKDDLDLARKRLKEVMRL